MTRTEALAELRFTLAQIRLTPRERDALFRASVEYAHAAAMEVLAECRTAIERELT